MTTTVSEVDKKSINPAWSHAVFRLETPDAEKPIRFVSSIVAQTEDQAPYQAVAADGRSYVDIQRDQFMAARKFGVPVRAI